MSVSVVNNKFRLAILGATSHIAKGLIHSFCSSDDCSLYLFARSPERVKQFLSSIDVGSVEIILIDTFSAFSKHEFDVIINCVGVAGPARLTNEMMSIFSLTETFDNLILEYLQYHDQTIYISLSSGVAYGTDFSSPANEAAQARININNMDVSEYYGIAKVNSEAKHRALNHLNIVDLRIFGYFSRFIELSERFLLSEVITYLKNGETLNTDSVNIIRDFVHPSDLMRLIRCCILQQRINKVFDVYSISPVGKFELLDYFALHHGLKYRIDESYDSLTVTGVKNNYYSLNRSAGSIGYKPVLSSITGIESELAHILKK